MRLPRFLANIVRKDAAPEIVTTRNFDELGSVMETYAQEIESTSGLLEKLTTAFKRIIPPAILGKGNIWDVRTFGTLQAAVTYFGSTTATLYITNTQTLTANVTTPSTLSIIVLKGGSFTEAYTLTINGPFECGLFQCFASNVTVVFGKPPMLQVKWFGATGDGSTDDTASFTAAKVCAFASGGATIKASSGIYRVSGIDFQGITDCNLIGDGPSTIIRGLAAGGTYVINLGDAGHVNGTRRCTFRDFKVSATAGTWTYGIRSLFSTDCHWDKVEVDGPAYFTTGVYWDYTFDCTWDGGRIESKNCLELGDNNVNAVHFNRVRMRANDNTVNTAAIIRGQAIKFTACDLSNGKYGIEFANCRGVTIDQCYFEDGTTAIMFGTLGGNSRCVSILGGYIDSSVNGIDCTGGQGHDALIVKGVYFSNLTTAINNVVNFSGAEFGPNYFTSVTNKYSRTFAHDHIFFETYYTQFYNQRKYALNTGDTSGSGGTVIIDLITTLTGDKPAQIRLSAVGRDAAADTKSFSALISINDDGTIENYSITDLKGGAITGFDVNAGNLRATGLADSNWNIGIESQIWED